MKKRTFVIPLIFLIAGAASMLFMTVFTTPYGAEAAGVLFGEGEKSENAQRKMIDIAYGLDPNGCNIYYGACSYYYADEYFTSYDRVKNVPDFAEKCVKYNKEYYELCKTGYKEDDSASLQEVTAGCQYVKALWFTGQTGLAVSETEKLMDNLGGGYSSFYGMTSIVRFKFTLGYMYNRAETDENKQAIEKLNDKLNEKYAEAYPNRDTIYENLEDIPIYEDLSGTSSNGAIYEG